MNDGVVSSTDKSAFGFVTEVCGRCPCVERSEILVFIVKKEKEKNSVHCVLSVCSF